MRKAFVVCLVAAVVGCSAAGDEPSVTTATSAPSTVTTTTPPAGPSSTVPAVDDLEPLTPYSVSISVSIAAADVDADLEVASDPTDLVDVDPFTRFSSCSGLRSSLANYSVTVVDVDADGEIKSVSVATADRVGAPGIHDADVRIEFFDAEAVTAIGTMTLDDGLRSGTFQAVESSGNLVAGDFQCDGPEGIPVPIDEASADDGVLAAVEVVALLRRDGAELVVALTLDTAIAVDAEAECPGVAGAGEPVLVSVDGDQTIGAINTFRLTPDPGATMLMRVGGASYVLEGVVVTLDPGATAGTFRGTTADGVAVDGAFRCV